MKNNCGSLINVFLEQERFLKRDGGAIKIINHGVMKGLYNTYDGQLENLDQTH